MYVYDCFIFFKRFSDTPRLGTSGSKHCFVCFTSQRAFFRSHIYNAFVVTTLFIQKNIEIENLTNQLILQIVYDHINNKKYILEK